MVILLLVSVKAYSQQQDVEFHLSAQLLQGKTILKVKRDFYDPYLWVLAKNNEVYRVNSVTLAVDNFTPQFSAYSNFQFIDIAGRSRDTVFVATNSTNVVEYKSGAFRLIGPDDGIPDVVNSIGMSQFITYQFPRQPPSLMIGTAKGFRLYDIIGEKISDQTNKGDSRVYEATYRTEVHKDSSIETTNFAINDTIDYQPITFRTLSEGIVDRSFVWEGGEEFGYPVNTVVSVYESIDLYRPVFTNLFWGTKKGLFQNYANYSNSPVFTQAGRYLNGINVNKVTTIYGLSSFGSGAYYDSGFLIKQNLLVGTDKGFYFSSSIYTSSPNILRPFSLFHFDALGNIRVNDVCVNFQTATSPVCEDGVWLACDNGLYLLKPDYAKFLNNQRFQAASFKDLPQETSSVKICAGTSINAIINTSEYRGHSYQWYKDGKELPGESQSSLSIMASGEYYAVLYDPCENIHLESNRLTVQVIYAPVFTFNYPDKVQYCDSASTTLKVDNNPGYHYRWYTNGILNGGTGYTYTITQSGKYKVEVSACTNSWVPSKEIEVDLVNLPDPLISADKIKYCEGENALLAVNIPADPSYNINWYKNGNIIMTDKNQTTISVSVDGDYSVMISSAVANCTKISNLQQAKFTPAPVFKSSFPDKLITCDAEVPLNVVTDRPSRFRWYTNGALNGNTTTNFNVTQSGSYMVEASTCDGSWVPSNTINIQLINLPTPVIQSDKTSYCIGDNAILTVSVPEDGAYTINWYRGSTLITSASNQTSMSVSESGNYSVSIISNVANTDGSVCKQTSLIKSIVFDALPTVSIEKIIKTTLCDGQTVDLKASYSSGKLNWNTGDTGDQITVNKSGTYNAMVTSVTGCSISSAINVQFFSNPILNLANAGVCVRSQKSVTLTAPAGMAFYNWNGKAGTNTYTVDHPQTVTLTVIDKNGCQATQDIQVIDECPNIVIPNAFTPNGDGVNDKWDIVGLEYDPTALVKIFTRYGQQVYESKGYNIPWDGTSRDKKLTPGVYYYIITSKNGSQTFSGAVTIIY